MRVQFLEPWHVGNAHYPVGEIVEAQDLSWPLPTTSVRALDQEALDALAYWIGEEQYHSLHFTPGLKLPELRYPPPPPQPKGPLSEASEVTEDAEPAAPPVPAFPRRI